MQLSPRPELYHNRALPIGSILREWRLEGVVGVGGFGIVYRAQGIYFNETVAIKEYFPGAISDRVDGRVVPANSATEQVYALGLGKFVEEAKLLWALSQPHRLRNIVSVRSLFEMHGTAYSVMDFEEGRPLEELLIERRRFDEASLMNLLRPLSEGLSRAHRAGVVHRDIKPANILIHDDGHPVLIDFGAARFESGEATRTGVTFFSPPYAALEQYLRSYPQGPWTDIYALGAVLFQCVTGRKPPEVLERMDGDAGVPLSAGHWPGFSRSFTRAVDAAMAVRPTDRPQSVREWLALFDSSQPRHNEELTRIQSYLSAEVAHFGDPVTLRGSERKLSRRARSIGRFSTTIAQRPRLMVGSGLALAFAALLLGATVHPQGANSVPRPPSSARLAGRAGVQTLGAVPPATVIRSLSQLSDDAATSAPPAFAAEIASARKHIERQTNDLQALGRTDAATDGAALQGTVDALIGREVDILLSVAKQHSEEVGQSPGAKGGAQAAVASYFSLVRSGAALKASYPALPPQESLEAGHRFLAEYRAFDQNYRDVLSQVLPARRRSFAGELSRAEMLANRTIASGNVARPWFFASGARKAAYQRLQAAVASSRALKVELGGLSALAKTADLAKLDQAVDKVFVIDRQLAVLASHAGRARASVS